MTHMDKHEVLPLQLLAESFMIFENTIYMKYEDGFSEIQLLELGNKVIPSVKTKWNVMPLSTQLYDGVAYQNILGKSYLIIPRSSKSQCFMKPVPELDGFRILDAKHENHVIVLSVHKKSKYHTFILRFDENYDTYDIRDVLETGTNSVNFIVLDNGVCVMINDDDSLEIFINKPGSTKLKRIEDSTINSSMKLVKDGIRVMFTTGNRLYKMTMK